MTNADAQITNKKSFKNSWFLTSASQIVIDERLSLSWTLSWILRLSLSWLLSHIYESGR
jgi:hypothetical protein